jgi:subtilisin-like proprotein convertase family protein
MKSSILTIISCLLCLSTFGQINVQSLLSSPLTINNFADSLQGGGIQLSNVVYTGSTDAIGYFTNGNSTLGVDRGLVMASGSVSQFQFSSNSASLASVVLNNPGDGDLTALAGVNTFDASVLEFDFMSAGDSVEIELVFASEEYPEYVCAFNDVFGFFLSGDGYNGTFTNLAENVAVLPNTSTPISINNVNNGNPFDPNCSSMNANYYVDNSTQAFPIVFDGFTIPIVLKFAVTPDSLYHFKLAIADAMDQIFDSAIFIQAQSFKTKYTQNPTLSAITSFGNLIANERCGQINLMITYPDVLTDNDTLQLLTGGVASPNDYANVPDTILALAGSTVLPTIQIPIIIDGISEGDEVVTFYLFRNGELLDTINVIIEDSQNLFANWNADTSICIGQAVSLDGALRSLTDEDFNFVNPNLMNIPNNGAVSSLIPITGLPNNATLTSVCLNINHVAAGQLEIYLVAPNGQILELSTNNGGQSNFYINTCFTPTATTPISSALTPATGNFIPEGFWNVLDNTPINGVWALAISDGTPTIFGDLTNWSLTFSTSNTLDYSWQPAHSISCDTCISTLATPTVSTSYTVDIQTLSGCIIQESVQVDVSEMNVQFNVVDDLQSTSNGSISANISGGIPPYHISWNTGDTSTLLTGLSAGYFNCTITDAIGCTISDSTSVSNATNTHELEFIQKLSVAPNPTSGQVSLELALQDALPLDIQVLSIDGKVLMNNRYGQDFNHQIQLDLSAFSNGVYMIRMYLEGEVINRKVVLQR